MNIGIVESGLPPYSIGGAETQAWELSKRLARNHNVIIFTKHFTGLLTEEVVDHVRIIRTRVLSFPLSFVSHVANSVQAIRRVSEELDVLLCFRATPGGIIGAIVKRLTGLRFCTSIRGGDWYFVKIHRIGRWLLRWVFSKSDKVIVQAEQIAGEVMEQFSSISPVIVPNGITMDSRMANGRAVLFVGNLIKRKGIDVLAEAMRELPNTTLVIVGNGPERKILERKFMGYDVRFLGQVHPERVRDIMVKEGMILVLPAVSGEGFPNVIMEAMTVGLPVVASDIAGISNLLGEGNYGKLVPARDPIALANALRVLRGDEYERRRLGKLAKRAVEQYSWERVVIQYEHVLQSVLQGSESTSG